MVRKWKLSATGSALFATALVVVACSSSEGDDDSGSGGKGATGGTGGTSGKGGSSGGMTTTGGSAGTGGTGGGSGGMATGGAGGAGGMTASGGAPAAGAGGGAAAAGPFACKGSAATCNTYENFATSTAAWWGSGEFNGGFSVFGEGIMRDTADTSQVHITGMVAGYGRGFNFWFSFCSDLSPFMGVTFTVNGTTMAAAPLTANAIEFQPQTNSNYPWHPAPMDKKGGCTSPTPADPWSDCIAPAKSVLLSDMPQTVLWTDAGLANGKPVVFDPATSPKEIVGIQFQFPWASAATPYAVDITLDNMSFAGAPMPIDCGTSVGSGGMGAGGAATGGASAGGASSGGASSGGMGGAAAGAGGAATGGAPTGGMSGASSGGASSGGAPGGGRGGRAGGGRGGGAGSP
jgi:hypothetical protein